MKFLNESSPGILIQITVVLFVSGYDDPQFADYMSLSQILHYSVTRYCTQQSVFIAFLLHLFYNAICCYVSMRRVCHVVCNIVMRYFVAHH